MIGNATLSEIASTFPTRGLKINGNAGSKLRGIFREDVCPWCGEKFGFYPGSHQYKRKAKSRSLYFDKPSCMRAWDEEHKSGLDRHIDDLKKRLIYLELQGKLPPHDREVKGDVYALIERTENRLSSAILKRSAREGLL